MERIGREGGKVVKMGDRRDRTEGMEKSKEQDKEVSQKLEQKETMERIGREKGQKQ